MSTEIHIKANENVPGLDHRVWRLPEKLEAAGIEVPGELEIGLSRARWTITLPDLEPHKARMAHATERDDFEKAARDLAETMAVRTAMGHPVFKGMTDGYRLGAVQYALRECAPELFTAVVDGFNGAVPAFTAALENVPDLTTVRSVYDLDPLAAQALTDAKVAAATLNRHLTVYCDLSALTGNIAYKASPKQEDVSDARALMTVLGSWRSGGDLDRAGSDVREYAAGHANHGPLSPYCVVAWCVDRGEATEFRMVLPDEAQERHEATRTGNAGVVPVVS